MWSDDDRNQPCCTNRSEARRRLQGLHDRVLLSFSKEVGLRLLLLLEQEVEMIVESRRSDLCAGGQLLQPLVAATRTVDIDACHENATRAVDTLDPRLRPHHISD